MAVILLSIHIMDLTSIEQLYDAVFAIIKYLLVTSLSEGSWPFVHPYYRFFLSFSTVRFSVVGKNRNYLFAISNKNIVIWQWHVEWKVRSVIAEYNTIDNLRWIFEMKYHICLNLFLWHLVFIVNLLHFLIDGLGILVYFSDRCYVFLDWLTLYLTQDPAAKKRKQLSTRSKAAHTSTVWVAVRGVKKSMLRVI